MARRYALLLLVFANLISCSGLTPNSAVPWQVAKHRRYPIDDTTPLIALEQERHIVPPTASSPAPVLVQLVQEISKSDKSGAFKGVTYDLTTGNTLPKDWIVQSPSLWGHKSNELKYYPLDCKDCGNSLSLPSCSSDADCNGGTCAPIWPAPTDRRAGKRKVCLGHSDQLPIRIHDLVVQARRRVDITLLQPPADARFLGALRDALQTLALSGRTVTVRIVVGQYPPDNVDAAAFLKNLTSDIDHAPGARLQVSVAAMRSCLAWDDCDSYSWNHSKVVAVDGVDALVGGHNMWSKDYLIDAPVHDISMQLHGPAAASAARFADRLWEFICSNLDKSPQIVVSNFTLDGSVPNQACMPPPPVAPAQGSAGLPVLAVGRMGAGITRDFANQSELARDLMFGAAEHTIRIAQQDIGFALGRPDTLYPESTLGRIVTFLLKKQGDVYIVLSNEFATGNSGSSYSNGVSLTSLARHLRELVQRRFDAQDPKERYEIRKGPDPINALLCEHVHLAPFRFGPDDTWPGGVPIANHAKFWMVDDRTFYIGSDNLYPVNLQEFGYILDDKQAASELLDVYWTRLWQWSARSAVSGSGVNDCIFRRPPK
jgi:phosphatidylserine/phosphatidylglycerophosphate/cardiolipin synthase-like enzyme